MINVVFPHFDNFPLQGSKYLDYMDFKKAVYLAINAEMPNSNMDKILLLKSKMNKGRSFEERWNYLSKITFKLAPEWIQAFIDGEGSFQCRIADKVNVYSNYIAVNPTLEIAQKSHEIFLLKAIINYLSIGYLKPKYDITSLKECKNSRIVNRAIFNQYSTIINFVDKYPMFTNKSLDYKDWKEIIGLKTKGLCKTEEEGLNHMIKLKLGMNTGRILNSNCFAIEDKRDIIMSLNHKQK